MKVIIDSEALKKAAVECLRFSDTKNGYLPILEYFKIGVSNNQLTITATNLHQSIVYPIPCEHEGEREFCVQAKQFTDTLKLLPAQPITIDSGAGLLDVKIHTDNAHFKQQGEFAKDFPDVPTPPDGVEWISGGFTERLEKATAFASTDELKLTLQGATLNGDGSSIRVYSSDGHRIYKYSENVAGFEGEAIIPIDMLKKHKHWKESELCIDKDHVFARYGEVMISSKLIDERSVQFENVFPKAFKSSVEMDKAEFLASVKRVRLFSNEQTNMIRLEVKEGTDCMTLEAENLDCKREAKETLKVSMVKGGLLAGFNAKLLETILKNAGSTVCIKGNGTNGIFIIQELNEENEVFGLMPIVLNELETV